MKAYESGGNSAYLSWQPESALELARAGDKVRAAGGNTGPLMDLPVSVKDMFGVPGSPTFAGCAQPLPEHWQVARPVIQALQSQLAPVVGKTHCVELAFGGLGTNHHRRTPSNPCDAQVHGV